MANTDATGKLGTGGEFHKFVTQWPTPQHADGERGSEKQVRGNPTLLGAARAWPTPNTGESPNGHGRRGGTADNGHQSGADLEVVAKTWATPSASLWRSGLASEQTMTRNSRPLNEQAVNLWPTPASGVFNDGESPESWRRRAAGLREKGINGNGAGTPLAIAAKESMEQWPTIHCDCGTTFVGPLDRHCPGCGRIAQGQVTYPSSRPDRTTPTPGDASSPSDPTSPPPSKKRLNPRFVEWLMLGRDRIGWTCTCANRREQTG
jgi:hypothetical protein